MLVRDLESSLLARFPRRDAEAWDHVGLSVGDPDTKVRGVLCSLDATLDSLLKLDGLGFAVSAASACSSGSMDASHVLRAMGIPREDALGSLRISFDDRVDAAALDRFVEAFFEVVNDARP